MRSKLTVWSSVIVVFIAAAAASCGPSPAAVCDAKCECERCSLAELDRCVAERSGDQQEADYRGCGGEYSSYLSCQAATAFCKGNDFETSCGPEKDAWKRCVDLKK